MKRILEPIEMTNKLYLSLLITAEKNEKIFYIYSNVLINITRRNND